MSSEEVQVTSGPDAATALESAPSESEKPKVTRRRRTTKSDEQPTLLTEDGANDIAETAPAKPRRVTKRATASKSKSPATSGDATNEGATNEGAASDSAPENRAFEAPQAPEATPSFDAPLREAAPIAPLAAETVSVAPADFSAHTPRESSERDGAPRDTTTQDHAPQEAAPENPASENGAPNAEPGRFERGPRDTRFERREGGFRGAGRENGENGQNGAPQNGTPQNGAPQPENRFPGGERTPNSAPQGEFGGEAGGFGDERGFDNRLRFRSGRNGLRRERPNNNGRNGRFEGRNGEGSYNPPPRRREYDLLSLEAMEMPELLGVAGEFNLENPSEDKDALIHSILEAQAHTQNALLKRGTLEILPDGKGFLRCDGYLPADGDVYVSPSQIKRFNLKTGDLVLGTVRAPKEMERFHGLLRVEAINGLSPEVMKSRKEFEKLTPIFPTEKFVLETEATNITARIIDLVSPIGKGSRGLIVAPPKAGKTTLIKNVANSIAKNHPEVVLIVLLIDERPEEVTDISRSIKGEVVASTFDELPENHMRVADIVLEKAKRLVEMKRDVVILMDSITRLSRASNLVVTPSGRTLSGGLDPAAMYRPKRMFGAARNIEEGGSLTILATALVDTGSRMDEMIFEEFKGTGNLDLVLDRNLFDQRIFPAIDINRSGTRRDDLLLGKEDLATVYHLRRTLAQLDNDKAVTLLIDRLKNTKSNADFMGVVAKSARNSGNGAG